MTSPKCLLVIDVQCAMFNLSRPLYKSVSLLENINSLIMRARLDNVPVVYVQHCGNETSPFYKGSAGWNIHPSISPEINELVIEKIYSDSFQETKLDEQLKRMKIERLVICGLVTEGCIDTTLRRAFSLGYKIELASDCHSTTDGNVLTADQIIKHHNEVYKIFAQVKEGKEISFNT